MKKIEELYVFVMIDEDGDETVPGYLDEDSNTLNMMVAATTEHVELLMPMAQMMAKETGSAVRILKFTNFTQVGEVNP